MFTRLKRLFSGAADPADAFSTAALSATDSNTPLIVMRGVTKTYRGEGAETNALCDVDLDVARGEFLAVNGPSGCGKSTLLSIAGLMDTPTSGSYALNGRDTATLSTRARAAARNREVGFIFQNFNLIGDLTVAENVELPLTYQGLASSERRDRVAATLERFDLTDRAAQYPGQLSGGHQQRVAVARAVVGRPAVLLADEPTGNLNSEQAQKVIETLQELHHEGSTILLVSHDPRWQEVARRTVSLFDGRLTGG